MRSQLFRFLAVEEFITLVKERGKKKKKIYIYIYIYEVNSITKHILSAK